MKEIRGWDGKPAHVATDRSGWLGVAATVCQLQPLDADLDVPEAEDGVEAARLAAEDRLEAFARADGESLSVRPEMSDAEGRVEIDRAVRVDLDGGPRRGEQDGVGLARRRVDGVSVRSARGRGAPPASRGRIECPSPGPERHPCGTDWVRVGAGRSVLTSISQPTRHRRSRACNGSPILSST